MGALMRPVFVLVGVCLVLSLVGCQHGRDVRSGDRYFSEGRYEEALESYRRAQVRSPESAKLALKVQETEASLISDIDRRLNSLLDAEMYLQAMELAGRGVGLFDERPEIVKLSARVRDVVAEKARYDAERGQFSSAMLLLETLGGQGLDPAGDLDIQSSSLRSQWVEYLDEEGSKAQRQKLPGRALLLYAKSEELPPEAARRELIGALYGEWRERDAYRIFFEPPTAQQRLLWNRVVSPLSEYTWPPGLIWSPTVASGVPGGAGTMAFTPPVFTRDQIVTTETEEYQSGTRMVENPFYKSRLGEVNAQEKQVTDAENGVTRQEQEVDRYRAEVERQGGFGSSSAGAQQNLRNAQSQLDSARNKLIDERQNL